MSVVNRWRGRGSLEEARQRREVGYDSTVTRYRSDDSTLLINLCMNRNGIKLICHECARRLSIRVNWRMTLRVDINWP